MSERPADPGLPAPRAAAELTFDAAIAELQEIVGRLETGGIPLERSIELYERGVALHERCELLLGDAELRVRRLVERAGGALESVGIEPGTDDPSA